MSASTRAQGGAGGSLGILIPCRNEAAVIERKLANLARLQWPERGRPHRLVVVDDDSEDGTFELAQEALARYFEGAHVAAGCLRNEVRPGKVGALCQGIEALEGEVELLVVTDADVVFDEWALMNLARAFDEDERLGMACGAQRFVRELSEDGSVLSPQGGPPRVASSLWDERTSIVRALESTGGRLFSVHGQLLAWRAALELRPTPGVAADDLDLMLSMRERFPELGVKRLWSVLFYERKTPRGADRDAQALRRARAYLQLFRAHDAPPPGLLNGLQWWVYRAAPWLILAGTLMFELGLLGLGLALWVYVPGKLGVALALGAIAAALHDVWHSWRGTSGVILRALLAERREPMPERWEMRRS